MDGHAATEESIADDHLCHFTRRDAADVDQTIRVGYLHHLSLDGYAGATTLKHHEDRIQEKIPQHFEKEIDVPLVP